MAAEFDVVDVFVGRFHSKKALEAYLAETYGEDDAPISAFARDLGQRFYDHDFMESAFRASAKGFGDLCEGMSYSESWLDAAREAFIVAGIDRPNTVLIAFDQAIDNPVSVSGPGYELHHLGRFRGTTPTPAPGESGPPAVCYLEFPPSTAFVNGQPATLIAIDHQGATLGHGAISPPPGLYIDLPSTPTPIAPEQARLYPAPFGQWILEDLAGNNATLYRNQEFNLSKAMPWHEITFTIGGIPILWLASKR